MILSDSSIFVYLVLYEYELLHIGHKQSIKKNIIHINPIHIIGIKILYDTLYSLSAKLKKQNTNNNTPNTKHDIGYTLFLNSYPILLFYFFPLNKILYKINTNIIIFINICIPLIKLYDLS